MTKDDIIKLALEALTIYSDAQCSLKGQAAITALPTGAVLCLPCHTHQAN